MCLDKPFRNKRDMRLIQNGANTTLNLSQAHTVYVLPWPSKSPDLNPVETYFGCHRYDG